MALVVGAASNPCAWPVRRCLPAMRAVAALLVASLLLVLPPRVGPASAAALKVGDVAPDFTLPATTGGDISLGQFRGKKTVLLEFYAADFSPV